MLKVPPHIIRLYVKTARRYRKLSLRVRRGIGSSYQRQTYLQKLRKIARTLQDLEVQLKVAAVTASLVLVLNTSPAQAQEVASSSLGPFVKHDRSTNPLREPIFNGSDPALAAIDFDKDGDFDIVLGTYDWYYGGYLRYFENLSSEGKPVYVERFGEENPFEGIHAQTEGAAPAFADIDNDGDQDLFIGQNGWPSYSGTSSQGIEYFRNDDGTFTSQTGAWNEGTHEGNPLGDVSLDRDLRPVFVDFDKDGDQDVIVGSYVWIGDPDNQREQLHYYVNNGNGTFTPSPINVPDDLGVWSPISPAVSDLDSDGDYDILLGSYNYGALVYLQQTTPGNFEVQWDEWDPATKTGHPFESFDVGARSSPVFVDFNQDGRLDLFLADQPGYNKYSDRIINYYENTGENVFVERSGFENPFDGVFVQNSASPLLTDLDNDGDLDALIGNYDYQYHYEYQNSYYTYSSLTQYNREGEVFKKIPKETETAFADLMVNGLFAPQLADLDADGDLDMISGNDYGSVTFFRNDDGVFTKDIPSNLFAVVEIGGRTFARLFDIDGDKDLDLFVSDEGGEIFYYQNTGTDSTPEFTQVAQEQNPLGLIDARRIALMRFTDLDHDGDADVLFNAGSPFDVEGTIPAYIENTGSTEAPVFDSQPIYLFGEAGEELQLFTIDYDSDGDLDAFAGNQDGSVSFFENTNTVIDILLNETALVYEKGTDAVIVDPDLTLTDDDDDFAIQAMVTIEDFEAGDVLDFVPSEGIAGVWIPSIGKLVFRGKATLADYQTLLRTVTFRSGEANTERRKPGKNTVVQKTIAFTVYDQDFTNPQVRSRGVDVFVNDAPSVASGDMALSIGKSTTLDLKSIISDPNGSNDLDLGSLTVLATPASGAPVTIDDNGILTIDYTGLQFTGTETFDVQVCDLRGACAQNTITVIVSNAPPVIEPEPIATPSGITKTVNLMTITDDVDGNLNHEGFTIVSQPLSGAIASIEILSPTTVNLLLNYEGITFSGTDELTIRACDGAGACTETLLQVNVSVDDSGITVYNAVAPNSTGDNKFMRINGLPESHKVSVFNRWGDKVFDTEDYGTSAFRGENNNGTALPSGTYFYTIEIPGEKMITGYLTLKQ